MATYECDGCKLARESFADLGGITHACNGDGLVLGHWCEIADKPATAAHPFNFGDHVRFVRGLPGVDVGTIGIVIGTFPAGATIAVAAPKGVSRSFTLGPGSDVYNLDAIEHIDAAPAPAPSATIPALAAIHDGTLGYTRAAWEEREAAHARELAALRVRLDAETERANRLADECGALADRLKAESRSNDLLTGRNSRLTSERDRARNELARRATR